VIREELAFEIGDPVQLGVLENRFEYRGKPGLEIVFVFDASFADRSAYDKPPVRTMQVLAEAGPDCLRLSCNECSLRTLH
jgi:hypothetical protein